MGGQGSQSIPSQSIPSPDVGRAMGAAFPRSAAVSAVCAGRLALAPSGPVAGSTERPGAAARRGFRRCGSSASWRGATSTPEASRSAGVSRRTAGEPRPGLPGSLPGSARGPGPGGTGIVGRAAHGLHERLLIGIGDLQQEDPGELVAGVAGAVLAVLPAGDPARVLGLRPDALEGAVAAGVGPAGGEGDARPSGDQANSPTPSGRSVSTRGSPPRASTTASCGRPFASARRNATAEPSGEYRGLVSRTPRVKRCGAVAPAGSTSQSCPTAASAAKPWAGRPQRSRPNRPAPGRARIQWSGARAAQVSQREDI